MVILAFGIHAVVFYVSEKNVVASIQTFEECEKNGYPVAESLPRQCRTPDDRVFVEDVQRAHPVGDIADMIRVDMPHAHATITSPLTVTGVARGQWYFEASFPVTLLDASGNELATVPAQAQGEWMTEDFVPFEAVLEFTPPSDKMGTLVFKKDNPSGLPEYDRSFSIPVSFTTHTTDEEHEEE